MKGNGQTHPPDNVPHRAAAALSLSARLGFWVWLRAWRRRPLRVFWILDNTGHWRRL